MFLKKSHFVHTRCNLRILKEEWFNVPTIAIKCQLWNINVAPSKEFSNVIMEIEKMYRKYNDCIIVKIKVKSQYQNN